MLVAHKQRYSNDAGSIACSPDRSTATSTKPWRKPLLVVVHDKRVGPSTMTFVQAKSPTLTAVVADKPVPSIVTRVPPATEPIAGDTDVIETGPSASPFQQAV